MRPPEYWVCVNDFTLSIFYTTHLCCTNDTRNFECSILYFHLITQLKLVMVSTAFSSSDKFKTYASTSSCLSILFCGEISASLILKALSIFSNMFQNISYIYGLVMRNCNFPPPPLPPQFFFSLSRSCTNDTKKFDCSILYFHHNTQFTLELASTAFSNSQIWILCLSVLL